GTQTRARRGAKLIDVSEADALSHATMSAQSAVTARQRPGAARAAGGPPPGVTGAQIAQACAAALVVEVQTKRLALEQRRGALISRDGTMWVFALRPSHPSARTVYHCPSVRDGLDAWALPRSSRLAGTPEAAELLGL